MLVLALGFVSLILVVPLAALAGRSLDVCVEVQPGRSAVQVLLQGGR